MHQGERFLAGNIEQGTARGTFLDKRILGGSHAAGATLSPALQCGKTGAKTARYFIDPFTVRTVRMTFRN
jgi:hypothetical protein